MCPAIALRKPKDFLTVIYVMAIPLAGAVLIRLERRVLEEGLCFLIDERACRSDGSIHFYHAIRLMPALIVFKGEAPAVFPPSCVREFIRIRKQAVIYGNLFF